MSMDKLAKACEDTMKAALEQVNTLISGAAVVMDSKDIGKAIQNIELKHVSAWRAMCQKWKPAAHPVVAAKAVSASPDMSEVLAAAAAAAAAAAMPAATAAAAAAGIALSEDYDDVMPPSSPHPDAPVAVVDSKKKKEVSVIGKKRKEHPTKEPNPRSGPAAAAPAKDEKKPKGPPRRRLADMTEEEKKEHAKQLRARYAAKRAAVRAEEAKKKWDDRLKKMGVSDLKAAFDNHKSPAAAAAAAGSGAATAKQVKKPAAAAATAKQVKKPAAAAAAASSSSGAVIVSSSDRESEDSKSENDEEGETSDLDSLASFIAESDTEEEESTEAALLDLYKRHIKAHPISVCASCKKPAVKKCTSCMVKDLCSNPVCRLRHEKEPACVEQQTHEHTAGLALIHSAKTKEAPENVVVYPDYVYPDRDDGKRYVCPACKYAVKITSPTVVKGCPICRDPAYFCDKDCVNAHVSTSLCKVHAANTRIGKKDFRAYTLSDYMKMLEAEVRRPMHEVLKDKDLAQQFRAV